jgi:hypothetical protein
MRIENEIEAVIDDLLIVLVGMVDTLAIQEDAEGLGKTRIPVIIVHLATIRLKPGNIVQARLADRFPFEPMLAGEHRMGLAEPDQSGSKFDQVPVSLLPVKPGDIIILTVSIIVAFLSVAHFVTGQKHRHALG